LPGGSCSEAFVVTDTDLQKLVRVQAEQIAALQVVEKAARRATTDDPRELAGSVEHPQTCALWVELDDVTGAVHPVGTCDCGLAELVAALALAEGCAAPALEEPHHG
jgi:hypothetical protein